jgi:hypothetical protein
VTERRSRTIKPDRQVHFRPMLSVLAASVVASLLLIAAPLTTDAQGAPDLVVTSVSGPANAQTEETITRRRSRTRVLVEPGRAFT